MAFQRFITHLLWLASNWIDNMNDSRFHLLSSTHHRWASALCWNNGSINYTVLMAPMTQQVTWQQP